MKKIVKRLKIIGVCFAAAFLISCEDAAEENSRLEDLDMGIKNVQIPEWSINEDYGQELPALVFDASATNYNSELKEGVKGSLEEIDVKNVVFMFFDGLTDDLISAAEARYANTEYAILFINTLVGSNIPCKYKI